MARPKIPKAIENRLLYESAYACVVCQSDGCHIHHIDQDHSNNKENNLVVLCIKHHDEAHTKRQLSKNLDSMNKGTLPFYLVNYI
ncbi:HNH endonuclease signature motif containing protein [Bathymodiolus septemdierum thioautotrophic gill symbiont]|uniref:HNH endonuclease signature motif containing protein n=1 Tax=Bathymodiolus septemdierum thioautotrophic gill symbiont TaxID=113267 RepID=UPI0008252F66|nr:HNH endonuclease signature motif containing protein [Bathymodiolus septemdierum thioautotrophic gill symbiont]